MTADATAPALDVECRYMLRVAFPVRPAAAFNRGGGGTTGLGCLPRRYENRVASARRLDHAEDFACLVERLL